MNPKVDLLIIDPQVDFCNSNGALFVPGADSDCLRLSDMIRRISNKINGIHVTLDTHQFIHIAHPIFWWSDFLQKHPAPFTTISVSDVQNSVWRAFIPMYKNFALNYVEYLEKNNRYNLCIWPLHCLIGSHGHNVEKNVYFSISEWERKSVDNIDYIIKGSNFKTEHYSAVMADVPDLSDPSTLLNIQLINTLQNVDIIGISGQALSHCVANTVIDIANNFGEENIKKIVLIEDTCSSVSGFEQLGQKFISDMTKRGMQISKSTEFLT